MAESKKSKRGRKAHITLEVVKRVSERVGIGLTLQLALAAEHDPCINCDSWEKAIKRNAEFVAPYAAAKADFLQKALSRLAEAQDLANLRWLLERRHSDLFARPSDTTINVSQSIVGIPDDVLAKAREYAKSRK